MEIEVGKFYQSRSGRRIRIYAVDGIIGDYIHGAYFNVDFWYSYTWDKNGLANGGNNRDEFDIISEWPEPEKKPRWLAWACSMGGDCLRLEFFPEGKDDLAILPYKRQCFRMPHLDPPENWQPEGRE